MSAILLLVFLSRVSALFKKEEALYLVVYCVDCVGGRREGDMAEKDSEFLEKCEEYVHKVYGKRFQKEVFEKGNEAFLLSAGDLFELIERYVPSVRNRNVRDYFKQGMVYNDSNTRREEEIPLFLGVDDEITKASYKAQKIKVAGDGDCLLHALNVSYKHLASSDPEATQGCIFNVEEGNDDGEGEDNNLLLSLSRSTMTFWCISVWEEYLSIHWGEVNRRDVSEQDKLRHGAWLHIFHFVLQKWILDVFHEDFHRKIQKHKEMSRRSYVLEQMVHNMNFVVHDNVVCPKPVVSYSKYDFVDFTPADSTDRFVVLMCNIIRDACTIIRSHYHEHKYSSADENPGLLLAVSDIWQGGPCDEKGRQLYFVENSPHDFFCLLDACLHDVKDWVSLANAKNKDDNFAEMLRRKLRLAWINNMVAFTCANFSFTKEYFEVTAYTMLWQLVFLRPSHYDANLHRRKPWIFSAEERRIEKKKVKRIVPSAISMTLGHWYESRSAPEDKQAYAMIQEMFGDEKKRVYLFILYNGTNHFDALDMVCDDWYDSSGHNRGKALRKAFINELNEYRSAELQKPPVSITIKEEEVDDGGGGGGGGRQGREGVVVDDSHRKKVRADVPPQPRRGEQSAEASLKRRLNSLRKAVERQQFMLRPGVEIHEDVDTQNFKKEIKARTLGAHDMWWAFPSAFLEENEVRDGFSKARAIADAVYVQNRFPLCSDLLS